MTPESHPDWGRSRQAIEDACEAMTSWLTQLPEWPHHPTNATGTVSSHYGPTILSEHDCVMQFAQRLNEAGIAWEDMHLEFSPGRWMFTKADGAELHPPKRIDLAIISRERLLNTTFPIHAGGFRVDAVIEFALASNYWEYGTGSKKVSIKKIAGDITKVQEYLDSGLARHGYVVVVEETDHGFPAAWDERIGAGLGVRTRVLRRWR